MGSLQNQDTTPLLVELGTDYCLLAQMDPESGIPLYARLWAFEDTRIDESLENIGAALSEAGMSNTEARIAISFPETVVLPITRDINGKALHNAVFSGQNTQIHHTGNGKSYAFSLPAEVSDKLSRQFKSLHLFAAAACMPQQTKGSAIHAYFIDSQLRVTVYKDDQLQLVQQYSFATPLDAVYYLLKVCGTFDLSQQETPLLVSGFITEGSALYREVYQYFLNIRFEYAENLTIDGQEVPKHYFSSLYNLAACAS